MASCANIDEVSNQPAWDEIRAQGPDLLLLLGDQIYYNRLTHDPGASPAEFEARLKAKYDRQWVEPHFKQLLASGIPWTAIWDDHDYAWNNAGIEVDADRKARSTRLFLQYQGGTIEPARARVHHSFLRGGVRFVMLDARSWREPAGSASTPLGLPQEQFLWDELKLPATLRVVCCGSPLTIGRFTLSDYPAFAKRFADFLEKHDLRILFLAGDVHDNTWDVAGRIIELISSGIAREYLFAKKRNYTLLDLDLNARKAVFRMFSRSQPSKVTFDLAAWREV